MSLQSNNKIILIQNFYTVSTYYYKLLVIQNRGKVIYMIVIRNFFVTV